MTNVRLVRESFFILLLLGLAVLVYFCIFGDGGYRRLREHRKEFENLDDLFWRAIHQAGDAKKSVDPADGQKLVDLIDEIAEIFWKTEKAKDAGVYPPS